MRIGLAATAAVALGAALTACGPGDQAPEPVGPPPATTEPPSSFFGVNGDVLFTFLLDGLDPLVDRHLDQIEAAPIGAVRASLDWRRIEPGPPSGARHTYDFSSHDAWVEALARHGLRWAPTVLGFPAPQWAGDPAATASGCGSRAPPTRLADYAAFAGALARRYGRGGSFWRDHPELPGLPVSEFEIWNEPNHGAFWCPEPNPMRYAEMAVLASAAIRAADPSARVVLGGLAPFDESAPEETPPWMSLEEFVDAAVAAEPRLPGVVDRVAVHAYGSDPGEVLDSLASSRASLDEAGFAGIPMVVNEAGWPRQGATGGFTVVDDEGTRATYIGELAEAVDAAAAALDVASFAPYSWVTAEASEDEQEQWFGLADPQTTEPYEAGIAYRDAVDALSSQP